MKEEIRPLTPQETCAMYHYHNEYAALGIGAIAYYKGLSVRDKRFINDMTAAILNAAQQSAQDGEVCPECKELYSNHHQAGGKFFCKTPRR